MKTSTSNLFSLVDHSTKFVLQSSYKPCGDQPQAIAKLVENLNAQVHRQTLLGVTGSGKTFTIANVIAQVNRPTLVLAHNKTLAAQLYSEFLELFPENAVRYFVSYFDYYQPEAYIPSTDTYIEKDSSINAEIDKLRHAATKALLERRDVIVVSSVSCIYGLGSPQNYFEMMIYSEVGDKISRDVILKKLVSLQYERNDEEFTTGTFRVRGDVVEVCPASESERSLRFEFFGDEIEGLFEIDRLSGKVLRKLEKVCIYPASHFVSNKSSLIKAISSIRRELKSRLMELESSGKLAEAARLRQRTNFDLEMLNETGFCAGIENYSRHLAGRGEGETPATLLDYFPDDVLLVIDESHATVPQLVGMYRGDRARKQTLVDFGFRLPSALDNRPLRFDEFDLKSKQVIFVSATPAEYELGVSREYLIHQIIRPTGVVDPKVEVRPATNQVDDFLERLRVVTERGERALATTLTKKMAEDLTAYYRDVGVRVRYLHADVSTLDRVDLIRGLRSGEFDLLIGINLLREGLDLPEVSLIGIMDADQEGFLRSERSLIQTIGRAARNLNGHVILYADRETDSIKRAILETNRRRTIQEQYNIKHGIIPTPVRRAQDALLVEESELDSLEDFIEGHSNLSSKLGLAKLPVDIAGCKELISRMNKEMFVFAGKYEFEQAAILRDQIQLLEKYMLSL